MMTPTYRKASIAVLVEWAQTHHPEPEKFLRTLAEATDEGLSYMICEGQFDELIPLTDAWYAAKRRNEPSPAHQERAHPV